MPAILIILIAIVATMLAVFISGRRPVNPRGRALGMVSVGFGLVALAVVGTLATDEAVSVAPGVVGVAFIAIGARRLRLAR